jgi:hypothetical protein
MYAYLREDGVHIEATNVYFEKMKSRLIDEGILYSTKNKMYFLYPATVELIGSIIQDVDLH